MPKRPRLRPKSGYRIRVIICDEDGDVVFRDFRTLPDAIDMENLILVYIAEKKFKRDAEKKTVRVRWRGGNRKRSTA